MDHQQAVAFVNQKYGYGLEERLLDRKDFSSEGLFSSYREEFWNLVITDYSLKSKNAKRNEKVEYMLRINFDIDAIPYNSLGQLQCKPKQEERKETNMHTENDNKRDHLMFRLNRIESNKVCDAERHFGLRDDELPATSKELVKRIQEGKFVLRERLEDDCYDGPLDNIRWRDPNKVRDKDGYDAFYSKMLKDYADTQDIVAILDPAEGLKAVREFEAKTYN